MHISDESLNSLLQLQAENGVVLEGKILNFIEATDEEREKYIKKALQKDKEVRLKRVKLGQDLQKAIKEAEKAKYDAITSEAKAKESERKTREVNKKLEEENDGARTYNLKMEELKANNKLKMNSLLIVMLVVSLPILSVLWIPVLTPEYVLPEGVMTPFFTIAGALIGGFLTDLLIAKKKSDITLEDTKETNHE